MSNRTFLLTNGFLGPHGPGDSDSKRLGGNSKLEPDFRTGKLGARIGLVIEGRAGAKLNGRTSRCAAHKATRLGKVVYSGETRFNLRGGVLFSSFQLEFLIKIIGTISNSDSTTPRYRSLCRPQTQPEFPERESAIPPVPMEPHKLGPRL